MLISVYVDIAKTFSKSAFEVTFKIKKKNCIVKQIQSTNQNNGTSETEVIIFFNKSFVNI